jgi:acyl-CoA synthetase (AMP-forming)/AMP-acid ligase II
VLPTSPDFVACFFGVLMAGAVPVPLYPPIRLGRLEEYHRRTAAMLQAVDASLVVTDERIRRMLGVAVQRAAPRLGCVTASGLGKGTDQTASADVTGHDLAFIQFSSGSTADPKPVALTHSNILANLAMIKDYTDDEGTENPVGVTWLPLYHDMGLVGNLLLAFYAAAPLVLIPPEMFLAVPGAWLRAMSRHGGTHTTAPNFAFGLCLKRIRDDELEGVDLSTWRVCLNGAEPISAAVQERFAERFGKWGFPANALTPAYGMAEASLALTFKPAHQLPRSVDVDAEKLAAEGVVEPGGKRLVSVGRPVAGVDVEVRDQAWVPLAEGFVGRIFVKGPNIMNGYFGRTDLTDQALHDGWLDTGDLGFLHDGELVVCGRHKDLVIVRGSNHAPQDFEVALEGLDGVRSGCVVAVGFVPDGHDDEALAMLVETDPDASPTLAQDIASRVEEVTRIRPAHVELLAPGTLPRTSSGKMRRREALTQWLTGTLAPPKKVTAARLLTKAASGEVSHTRAKLARQLSAKKRSEDVGDTGATIDVKN